jgi:sodium transport system permease protein
MNLNLRVIASVLKKELRDGLRDRRAVLAAMFFPVLGPAIVYWMLTSMIDLRKEMEELTIPVMGADHAPAMVAWLAGEGVNIEEVSGDPKELVLSKRQDMVLVIPEDYGSRLAGARSATVHLVSDGSRADVRAEVERTRALIASYSRRIAALRLIVRGIAPEITQPVIVQEIEVASKQQIAGRILAMIPMYIVMAAFICGMGIAVDSTAGERERSTLESLLVNPVERDHLVIGKWLAASLFAAVGVVLTMLLCFAALTRVPLEEVGLSFRLGSAEALGMLGVILPLALMATGLQLLLGIFAKSFKDAQSYIGLLILLPVVPSMITIFHPITSKPWMSAIPGLGHHLLLTDVIGGKTPELSTFVLCATSALLVAILCIRGTAKLFCREAIIFSR